MPSPNSVIGHCMKCKTKREVVGGKPEKNPNGTMRHKDGVCSKCGTKMSVILPKAANRK